MFYSHIARENCNASKVLSLFFVFTLTLGEAKTSTNQKVTGSIPGLCSLHVEVSCGMKYVVQHFDKQHSLNNLRYVINKTQFSS